MKRPSLTTKPEGFVVLSGISPSFDRLSRAEEAGYLRVTHPFAALLMAEATFSLDLHVLGTPPAFVLSQNQTLQFKSGCQ